LKAIVYTKYGGPEVLQIKEVDKPSPNDDEVLVKVYAVSLNDSDWGLLHGDFARTPGWQECLSFSKQCQ
jgi:NADPH:quinone reductase-like Zn-dependent oxidoreductase